MKKSIVSEKAVFPQDQNFWYLNRDHEAFPLQEDKEADVVVIGGGMAGITAAHAFARKNKKVILLEAFYCGAGASGKSSGFITPNGEISLSEFVKRYGVDGGKAIWDSIEQQGVEYIRATIKEYDIACDYVEEDSLEVASTQDDVKMISQEAENLIKCGYDTQFIEKSELSSLLGTDAYYGAVMYPKSFSINTYKYCQAMKQILTKQGVEIYEETPALAIQENLVTTLHARIKGRYIIVCADRFIPTLGKLTQEIYHVQNFLLISQVLTQDIIRKIFPQKRFMVWDTDLIYQFYRMAGDRLLIGGGSPWNAYDSNANYHSDYMYKKLTRYIKTIFPEHDIQYEQMWPGLIGVSKDIAPLVGHDKDSPSLYYIGAVAGLPVAAMLGNYCAENLLDGVDTLHDYFSPYRSFPVNSALQHVLGTKLSFAISHWLSHGNT